MNKIGGVIVSHGQVANELLAAAETVVGDLSHITAVSIGWHDDVELAKDEIARAIKKCRPAARARPDRHVRRDPTNISAMFIKETSRDRYRCNLPMIISLPRANRRHPFRPRQGSRGAGQAVDPPDQRIARARKMKKDA